MCCAVVIGVSVWVGVLWRAVDGVAVKFLYIIIKPTFTVDVYSYCHKLSPLLPSLPLLHSMPHTPAHPLPPPPPPPQVMQIMSQVLEVSQAEIKETVRRDRCDWLAAIYNLLIDQPEGRNILQSMITGDPEDQLVDAAHYQGSVEHLRLSQAGEEIRNEGKGGGEGGRGGMDTGQ